jgi:hypothetical protein
MNGNVNSSGAKLGFFVSEMCVKHNPEEIRGWFFDIYIQGSKKYNFKS